MKRTWIPAFLAGAPLLVIGLQANAQIRYLTVRAPRSPVPPMVLVPPNTAPGPTPQPVTVAPVLRQAVPIKPSLDKEELERRVVAFQKQRAEEGSASAQYELGVRYLKGDGVQKDALQGRKWLTLAASAGNLQAQSKLQQIGVSPP